MTKLTATTRKLAGLNPLAAHVLRDMRVEAAIAQRSGRAPMALYNLAFRCAVASIAAVLDEVEPLYCMSPTTIADAFTPSGPAMKATEKAMHDLVAYYDKLQAILGGFYPEGTNKAAKNDLRTLKEELKPHRDAVALSINRVKHNHARLNVVAYFAGQQPHPGWWVENGLADGTVGPDPEVHAQVLAFSYARTLRAWSIGVIEGAVALGHAVARAAGVPPSSVQLNEEPPSELVAMLRRVYRLPVSFFPDEKQIRRPIVALIEKGEYLTLHWEWDGARAASVRFIPREAPVFQAVTADGVTNTFRMPHRP